MFEFLIKKLKAHPRKIVFTEGTDPRILEASARLLSGTFLTPVLVGNLDEIQAAAEEAARQAQQQAEQQQAQQQTAPPSIGTVRGGSFCSSEGSTGTSSAGNILTCRVASDGRLRWMK